MFFFSFSVTVYSWYYFVLVSDTHTAQWLDSHILYRVSTSHTVITVLLTIFPMLCFMSLWLFCNFQFVLLQSLYLFHPFSQSPSSPLAAICLFLYISFNLYWESAFKFDLDFFTKFLTCVFPISNSCFEYRTEETQCILLHKLTGNYPKSYGNPIFTCTVSFYRWKEMCMTLQVSLFDISYGRAGPLLPQMTQ